MATLRVMHDIADGQLLSADGRRLGRVADIACRRNQDGTLEVVELVLGPEATLRRVSSRLRGIGRRLFGGRHERSVPMSEVVQFGPTIRLRGSASDYDLHDGDAWAARVLRWIPGIGYDRRAEVRAHRHARARAPDIWMSDLIGTPVVAGDRRLGQIAELHVGPRHHRVTELLPGSTGWLERLGIRTLMKHAGWSANEEPIDWGRVDSFGPKGVTLLPARGGRGRRSSERRTRR